MAEPSGRHSESRSFGVTGCANLTGFHSKSFVAVETIGGKFTLKSLTGDECRLNLILIR
jgi:hypothetical protein